MRAFVRAAAVAAATMLAASVAMAQDVTLRVHQFLPQQATIPARAITPWAEKVMAESGGRIRIEQYPSMQLGGKPPALYDQAKDGVVDVIWTVLGYTPGRFPKTEAFELPFVMTSGEATSRAFQAFVEANAMDEFAGVKLICVHTHGPGIIHVKGDGVHKLEDMKGLKLRGPTRVINGMLERLGATSIGMPVPAVPEALSKGVIDGTVIPWEVTLPLKVTELVNTHTVLTAPNGLYTATFGFVMNLDAYNRLPADLKKVIDDNSGMEAAALFGRAMDAGDTAGLGKAQQSGNTIITLDAAESARWVAAAEPVIDAWIAEMKDKGIDGQDLLMKARALVAKYSG
ncbi:MAG: TRAP transporter substrate-binding protein [Pseudomonadota bacterium]|nr:TRAP transporter substrate-binding protein [Pseudomonadota bacterium]